MKSCELQDRLLQVRNGCLWSERGTGKSYGLARVAFERHANRPVVVVGPGFRQSRIVRSYLQQICDVNHVDINTINVICVPVSDLANTIVGLTDFLLLVDEVDFIPKEYWKQIVTCEDWVGVASSD